MVIEQLHNIINIYESVHLRPNEIIYALKVAPTPMRFHCGSLLFVG